MALRYQFELYSHKGVSTQKNNLVQVIYKVSDGSQFLEINWYFSPDGRTPKILSKLAFSKTIHSIFEVFALDNIGVKQTNKQIDGQKNKPA